ncbi:MAG: acylneuraminate cytidylyltransferase family protein [Proteobacteria bacterium]|nr:acylneuraminate cytidylyltransferase family protein [Pseudomonadota bacterium]
MIGGKRVVALIPARAGSKSIPRKNLVLVGGRSLLARAIDQAKGCAEVDRIVVSTDGAEIAAAARAEGAEVLDRPAHLAGDTALVIDTIRDAQIRLRAAGETAAYMCLLEPTTPLRRAQDIADCLRKLDGEELDSVATFREPDLNPHRAWRIADGRPQPFIEGAIPWLPRQKLPPAYQLSGGVYAWRIDGLPADSPGLLFGRMGAIVVDRARSIDIDEPTDLLIVEALLAREGSV